MPLALALRSSAPTTAIHISACSGPVNCCGGAKIDARVGKVAGIGALVADVGKRAASIDLAVHAR